jgi:hypothetical protein
MQHNSIEECMSIAALNAFQRDINTPVMKNARITGTSPAPGFSIAIRFSHKIADRFPDQNRIAIFPERFLIVIVIAIAISKSGSDLKMKFAYRF